MINPVLMEKKLWDILIAIVVALGGWQFVKYMLNLNSNRRITAANAFSEEYKAVIEDYRRVQKEVDEAKAEIKSLNDKVDDLYAQLHSLEKERLDLLRENGELKLKLKEAEHNVCMRPDGDCVRRLPPRAYCALYKVAGGLLISDEARKDKEEHKDENNDVPEEPR